ncbi:hypothetical protein [Paraliomyxa miuraensis]|uniref:hypothetical protein n=1 Tax=Paraliomyxa miuraensis TaxID=376150 RepID=UPI00224C80EA|nr:hypothetical protein [Paraliomyxa miuraensis]MCX4247529.1 hypothetical protein [Paraliomyxa miuraensis]
MSRTNALVLALRPLGAVAALALRPLGAAALLLILLLPRASWAGTESPVAWGLHRVELEHATVVVRSELRLEHATDEPIALAAPLPVAAELTGAEPVLADGGTIVALRAPEHASALVLEVRVPWGDVRRSQALPVPVPEGRSVHRVVLSPALGFSPDPALGLIAQVGHYAPAEIDVVARHRFDARTDGDLRHVGAYYVRGDDLRGVGSLHGEVVLQRQRMGRVALVVGVVFVLVVGGMIVVHRRLDRAVRYERAEAYLAKEMEALEEQSAE